MDSLDFTGHSSNGTADVLREADVLTAVLENLDVGVIVCDAVGILVIVNPEAERMFGVGAKQLETAASSPAHGIFRPDMVTPFLTEDLPLARAIRGEETQHELIFVRNLQQPGLWIDASGKPMRDGSGTVCGGVLIFSDISLPESLLRNEPAARAYLTVSEGPCDPIEHQLDHDQISERFGRFRTMYEQLARAVDQTADCILITDGRGIIEYVNPSFERVTGFTAAEVLGRKPNVLKSGQHDASFYADLWDRLTSGNSFTGIIINRKKSGDLIWCNQTISPVKDQAAKVTHYVSVLRDITSIRKKREQEFQMSLARELQQRYYQTKASLPGFDIAAAAYPADAIGGDYFDFIPQRDGSLYIVMADIMGHGLGSALTMAEVRASVRAYGATTLELTSLLRSVHHSLRSILDDNRFVTMFLGRIDPQNRILEYASAGHETGYVLRHSGGIGAVLPSTGPPLGLFHDQQFALGSPVELKRGNTLLLLTDGVTEAIDITGSTFGIERALDFIRSQQRSTASEQVHGLYNSVRTFAGGVPQMDDITCVVCKVLSQT